MKTIREIADEIGVSKQAVFKKIKREPLSTSLRGLTSTVDGRLTVSVDGEKLIKQAFSAGTPSTNHQPVDGVVDGQVDGEKLIKQAFSAGTPSTNHQPVDGVVDGQVDGIIAVLQATIDTLQGQLEVKDRQIEQQTQTITRLSDALVAAQQTAAAAQALHAGTIQQQLLSGEAGADQQHPEPESGQKRSWFSWLFRN